MQVINFYWGFICIAFIRSSNGALPDLGSLNNYHLGIRILGSYNPYKFTYERNTTLVNPEFPSGYRTSSTVNKPTFRAPWSMRGEINYALTHHIESFISVEYSKGSGKSRNISLPPVYTYEPFSNYHSLGVYLGSQYYSNRWSLLNTSTSAFLGFKAGALWRDSRKYSVYVLTPLNYTYNNLPFSESATTPSAGLQAGLDFLLRQGFSLNLLLELVYSGPIKSNQNIVPPPNPLGLTRIIGGENGPMLSYPITVGIKKVF